MTHPVNKLDLILSGCPQCVGRRDYTYLKFVGILRDPNTTSSNKQKKLDLSKKIKTKCDLFWSKALSLTRGGPKDEKIKLKDVNTVSIFNNPMPDVMF